MNPRLPALARISLRMQCDERLAELVGLGSEAAFEAIVHRYRAPLVRHCAQVVGRDDADEAVQDALLKAHRALAAGTVVHSLGPWLHAIAHNSALSLLRSHRPATEYREEHEAAPSTEVSRDQLEALMSALLALPVRQRRALVMRELEGRSYEEIAAHLGASHGAVRQLLNRARSSVRARFAALIPAELVIRWVAGAGGAAGSGALTLAGGGAFAAKLSSAVLLSAVPVVTVPVVTVAPLAAKAASPRPAHAARTAVVGTVRRQPAHASALRQPAHVSVLSSAPSVIVARITRSAAGVAPGPKTAWARRIMVVCDRSVASGLVASGVVASGGVARGGVASGGVASGVVASGAVATDVVATSAASAPEPPGTAARASIQSQQGRSEPAGGGNSGTGSPLTATMAGGGSGPPERPA
jgi:RNA polymerase sigma factor (sigma-70 family)